MTTSLYVATLEPDSGKLAVTIGLMELLSRRIRRMGFFRPVTPGPPDRDNDMAVILSRYPVAATPGEMHGFTHDQARELVSQGRIKALHEGIIAKFKELEKRCDFVLCEGLDISSLSEAFEFDINVDIARNLGVPALYVSNGHDKDADEILRTIRVAEKSFHAQHCHLLGIIVNRVSTAPPDEMYRHLREHCSRDLLLGVLPEIAELSRPTVGEIMEALRARFLLGSREGLHRSVASFKVAAMGPENYLSYIGEDDLILTPGDRPDIILTTLAAMYANTWPNLAGLLLTGDLLPGWNITRLIEGLGELPFPILVAGGDTYSCALAASRVQGRITPKNNRKINLALGLFESGIDSDSLEAKISAARSTTVSPVMSEYTLFQWAKRERKHIVLPEGEEERILRAAEILLLRGVVDLTLLGREKQIRSRCSALGIRLPGIPIINPQDSPLREQFAETYYRLRRHKGISHDFARDAMTDVSYFGTMMVYHDMVDGMVSGAVHTTQHTIRPAFEVIKTAPGVSLISSVFFMCLETRVLVFGDCAINPNPDAEQLATIAISSADTAERFGIEPLVAMLSYSSGESGKGEDVENVRRATEIVRRRRPDLKVEGPIQYDAAIDASVANTKMPGSEVAGRATVFIFPDLNTGNNTYKAVQRASGAVAIGPVLQGLKRPVNDLSRGCQVADIINTVAITAIQAQKNPPARQK